MDEPKVVLETERFDTEAGHAYAYGGGSIIAIVLIVLLLIWLF